MGKEQERKPVFDNGDLAALKSGGETMTVVGYEAPCDRWMVRVTWMSPTGIFSEVLPEHILKKV